MLDSSSDGSRISENLRMLPPHGGPAIGPPSLAALRLPWESPRGRQSRWRRAGVCLFLVVGSQFYEIYRYQFYLGQSCTALAAEFQGAYLALLITLSFLTWMAHHPRTAVP